MGKHSYNKDNDHFSQAHALFKDIMSETDRQHLFSNLANNLKKAAKHVHSLLFTGLTNKNRSKKDK